MNKYLHVIRKALMNWLQICLLLANAIIAFFSVYTNKEMRNEKLNLYFLHPTNSSVLYILIFVVFLISIGLVHQNEEKEKSESVYGTLEPIQYGFWDKIKQSIGSENNLTHPCICMGSVTVCDTNTAFRLVNDRIYVQTENGKLKISAKVRDESGKIMGKIENNTFESFKQYSLRSCHDDTGWEVLDPYGRVALQVDLSDSCAHIAGIFYSEDGKIAVVYPNNGSPIMFGGSKDQIRENMNRLWIEYPNVITPLFNYRSDKQVCERMKPN